MENMVNYSNSILSLLPPIIAIGMAIITRRVLLSLALGILLGSLMLFDFSPTDTTIYLFEGIKGLFIEDGSINAWNLSIISFLFSLGMITSLLNLSGGTKAFADWAEKKIKTKIYANLLTALLGIFIFIDDYFNSLAVGAVSRPIAEKFKISKEKVAYLLDSTAAPVCVLAPVSSWGAYIITLISAILVSNNLTEIGALEAFIKIMPMNFYAIFALIMVFVVVFFNVNIGPMKKAEKKMKKDKSPSKNSLKELKKEEKIMQEKLSSKQSKKGKVRDLIIPIVVLFISTIFFMIYTGYNGLVEAKKAFSLIGAFENTDVGLSLFYSGIISLLTALYSVYRKKIPSLEIFKTLKNGLKLMSSAVLILCFAWLIGAVIKDMQTGKYLSLLVQNNMNPSLLPVILFIISGIMAFATGTSWGTFGIMLPIAGDLAISTDALLLLPMLAAVLSGSVFGDHCSPISDTTILSSTGARCNHINHITTQLPYAIIVAIISSIAFLILGITESIFISFVVAFIIFIMVIIFFRKLKKFK